MAKILRVLDNKRKNNGGNQKKGTKKDNFFKQMIMTS